MVERSTDPDRAAARILEVAGRSGVDVSEVLTMVSIVAKPNSAHAFPITREPGRDRAAVMHEIAMHIGAGSVGTHADGVAEAVTRLSRAR